MMVTEFIYTAMGRLSAVNKSKARIDTDTLNYEMDASRILSIVNRQYVLRFCFSVLLIVFGLLYFFSSSQAGKEKSNPTREARDETNRKDLRRNPG